VLIFIAVFVGVIIYVFLGCPGCHSDRDGKGKGGKNQKRQGWASEPGDHGYSGWADAEEEIKPAFRMGVAQPQPLIEAG